MSDFLHSLKTKLKESIDNSSKNSRSELIIGIRKSYIEARNSMKELDSSLHLLNFIDCVYSITGLMLDIYMIKVGAQFQLFKEFSVNFTLESVLNAVKLIISCLIRGLVYDEIDSLYLSFDELDISYKNLDENGYKEALYFKSQTIDANFWFTIAGTIPFKRTTLLSV
jgi:hypothetical protein